MHRRHRMGDCGPRGFDFPEGLFAMGMGRGGGWGRGWGGDWGGDWGGGRGGRHAAPACSTPASSGSSC